MGVNKVTLNDPKKGEEVVVDLTGATMKPENLDEGVTGWDAEGNLIAGTRKVGAITILGTGSCGENAIWTAYGDGRFVISGTGPTVDVAYEDVTNTEWYDIRNDINTIIVENGITRLGEYLFCDFAKVVSVNIPESVVEIGDRCISYCTKLSEVVLPSGLNYLGNFALDSCISLRYVVIPEGITDLLAGVFQGCKGLESVVLPKGLTKIFYQNFRHCAKLAYVYFSGTKAEWDSIKIYYNDEDDNKYLFTATLCCEYDPNADTVDGWNVNVVTDDSDIENITEPTITFMYTVGG